MESSLSSSLLTWSSRAGQLEVGAAVGSVLVAGDVEDVVASLGPDTIPEMMLETALETTLPNSFSSVL